MLMDAEKVLRIIKDSKLEILVRNMHYLGIPLILLTPSDFGEPENSSKWNEYLEKERAFYASGILNTETGKIADEWNLVIRFWVASGVI